MKTHALAQLAMLIAAGPAAASTQLGWFPIPDVEYRSARQCERALDKLERAEAAIPQPPTREVGREGGTLGIVVTQGNGTRSRFYWCMGSTLTGRKGGVDGQTYPPQLSH